MLSVTTHSNTRVGRPVWFRIKVGEDYIYATSFRRDILKDVKNSRTIQLLVEADRDLEIIKLGKLTRAQVKALPKKEIK